MGYASDDDYMLVALRLANKAGSAGEVPVGAVVVHQGKIIGRGWNQVERKQDASQHAEMIAIRQAAQRLKTWRLEACDLYVTLEPCTMCAGAIVWSRIQRLVFGANDPKAGACGSVLCVIPNPHLNHRPKVVKGIRAQESRAVLQAFFKNIRKQKKDAK